MMDSIDHTFSLTQSRGEKSMAHRFAITLTALIVLSAASCHKAVDPQTPPEIVIDEVSGSEALASLDTARTYMYSWPLGKADSLIHLLVDRGLPVVHGWDAIDYLCADPIGSRFTVELSRADSSIQAYNFVHSVGPLACSTRLRRYTVQ
jgi:hypothetical protein